MGAPSKIHVRLEPMTEAEFQDSLQRSISLHAADYVRREIWTQEASLRTWATEFARMFPKGRESPGRHFANIVVEDSNRRVGETWYTVLAQGGKIRFWIDWIWIDPELRRKGYATAAMDRLEQEARRSAADRVELSVWLDNPGAIALYSRLGYGPVTMGMVKPLARVS